MQLEPNEARVMMFFGKYRGTFTRVGFYWVNPFINTKNLSLRARNLDAEPIKVNDKIGNPVMIGLVLVWKLKEIRLFTTMMVLFMSWVTYWAWILSAMSIWGDWI